MTWAQRRMFKGADGGELIHGRIFHQTFEGASAHSLKFYDGAPVRFWRGRREVPLDGHGFLLVNAGEAYAFEVPSPQDSRVTAAFFTEGQVAGAWRSLAMGESEQLDLPGERGAIREFSACQHRASPALTPFLAGFRAERDEGPISGERIDEILADLLVLALTPEAELSHARRGFSPLRAAQREEALRRVTAARGFIEANASRDLTLDEMAAAACLSRYHFLRRFKAVAGCTPTEFLRRVRLERAAAGILAGRRDLTEIALDAGYADLAAFSRGFRRRYGVAPSAYAQKRNGGQAPGPAL